MFRRLKQLAIALLIVSAGAFLWQAASTPRVGGLSIPEHVAYVASDLRGANDVYCMMRLEKLDADYKPAPFMTLDGCGNEFAVRASRIGGSKLKNAPLMSCSLAEVVAEWEKEVLQPAALEHLGKGVRRIQHLGTYNCRKVRMLVLMPLMFPALCLTTGRVYPSNAIGHARMRRAVFFARLNSRRAMRST